MFLPLPLAFEGIFIYSPIPHHFQGCSLSLSPTVIHSYFSRALLSQLLALSLKVILCLLALSRLPSDTCTFLWSRKCLLSSYATSSPFFCLFFWVFCFLLLYGGVKLRTSYLIGKYSTTKPCHQPLVFFVVFHTVIPQVSGKQE